MKVCVITGGGSGIGWEAARYMDTDRIILLAGRTEEKLEKGAEQLKKLGYTVYVKTCDVSNRESVRSLVQYALTLGEIQNVIHAAGISPAMGTPEQIIQINALGTLYVNTEFANVMDKGTVIVDVASNSAYELPSFLLPRRLFKMAERKPKQMAKRMVMLSRCIPGKYYQSGLAYVLSKRFVIWYSARCAFAYGKQGVRFCSLSPGLIDTDMGKMEKEKGMLMLRATAEKRMGKPEEIGYALAVAADERNGFLTGTDILCDGGAITKRKRFSI